MNAPGPWDPNARPQDEQAELLEALEEGRLGGRIHLQFDPWVIECAERSGWIALDPGLGRYSAFTLTTDGAAALQRWRADA